MADEDLERPPLVPWWLVTIVIGLAIFGAFALIGWVVRTAFGLARGLVLIALIVGVVALVRAFARRR
jgi:hypothetical protein